MATASFLPLSPTHPSMHKRAPTIDAVEGEDAPALPLTWRTLSDVARQVFAPSQLRADVEAGEAGLGVAPAAATLTLFNLFAHTPRRKRGRCGVDTGSRAPFAAGTSHATPRSCSAPLRRAVLAAIAAAQTSIGSSSGNESGTGGVGEPSAVVVAHLRRVPHEGKDVRSTTATTKAIRSRDVWCVDGVCVAEQRTRVFRALSASQRGVVSSSSPPPSCVPSQPAAEEALSSLQAMHTGTAWCPGTPLCGVRLVWVAPPFRRTGVACRLLEDARRSVCYGYEVPAAHVVFSEPTQMGSALARRYHMRDDFPVYAYGLRGDAESE